jgi:hypothetical protein
MCNEVPSGTVCGPGRATAGNAAGRFGPHHLNVGLAGRGAVVREVGTCRDPRGPADVRERRQRVNAASNGNHVGPPSPPPLTALPPDGIARRSALCRLARGDALAPLAGAPPPTPVRSVWTLRSDGGKGTPLDLQGLADHPVLSRSGRGDQGTSPMARGTEGYGPSARAWLRPHLAAGEDGGALRRPRGDKTDGGHSTWECRVGRANQEVSS